jgi:hypothetical protein
MTTTTWEKQLDALYNAFYKDVMDLAARYRREVIVPLCKEHGLSFTSGNGMFFFSSKDDNGCDISASNDTGIGTRGDRLYQKYKLDPIFEVLNSTVEGNQVFGYYVKDFPKKPSPRKEKSNG